MRVERLRGDDPEAAVARIRSLVESGASVRDDVEIIVERVRADGDAELERMAARYDDVEPPQRLRRAVRPLHRREDHPAAPVAEVVQLVDLALGLLDQDVLAGDAEVRGARLHVGRDVARAHRDDPGVLEQQLAVVRAHLRGVDAETVEHVERLAQQRAARDRDRQLAHAVRSSPASATCSRSTLSANPTAGSGRPKWPSRSS